MSKTTGLMNGSGVLYILVYIFAQACRVWIFSFNMVI